MKIIEELSNGDTFEVGGEKYLLSADFKKNGTRSAIALNTGVTKWFGPNEIVNALPLFYLDEEQNIVPVKHIEKDG